MTRRVLSDGSAPEFIVQGSTLEDLFEHVVLAVFGTAFTIDRVRVTRDVPVMAVGDTPEALLSDWLAMTIAAADEHGLAVTTVAVDRLEVGGVQGAIGGFPRSECALVGAWPVSVHTPDGIVTVPDGFWVRVQMTPRDR